MAEGDKLELQIIHGLAPRTELTRARFLPNGSVEFCQTGADSGNLAQGGATRGQTRARHRKRRVVHTQVANGESR